MQVTKEPLDQCQVALTIEVEQDKVVHAVDQAYREYARRVSIPGFRKGKAPMHFVRQRVAESDVKQRTAEILVEPAYLAALKEADVKPYTQPSLEIVQLDLVDKPFIFKAVIPLPPHVELGQYTGLSAERTVFDIPESLVEQEIDNRRKQAVEYPLVERPAQSGDFVIAEVAAVVEGRPSLAEPKATMIEIGGDNLPGFDEQLIGLSAGDTKSFDLEYPADHPQEELQGLPVNFTVTVKEVRESVVPALDDETAAKITKGKVATVAEWRTVIRTEIEAAMTRRSDQAVDGNLLTQIVHNSTVSFPPVMLDTAVEEDVEELERQLGRAGMTIDEYANRQETTRDALLEGIRKEAEQRLRAGLVLGEIADKEKLAIADIDMSSAIAEQATKERTTPAALRAMLESTGAIKALRSRVQTKKVLDFLRGSAIIKEKVVTAPTGDLADPSPEAAKTAPVKMKNPRIKKGADAQ